MLTTCTVFHRGYSTANFPWASANPLDILRKDNSWIIWDGGEVYGLTQLDKDDEKQVAPDRNKLAEVW